MLGLISQIEAQEEQPRQLNEQQQEEEKRYSCHYESYHF